MSSSSPATNPSADDRRCSFDPNAAMGDLALVMRNAAQGDLAAQRVMRNRVIAWSDGFEADAPNALLYGLEVVPYARLCAAHGDDEDARRLAGVLCYTFEASRFAGFGNRAEGLAGEAVSILERLAERGDEASALAAVQIVNLHPNAGDIAKRLMSGGN